MLMHSKILLQIKLYFHLDLLSIQFMNIIRNLLQTMLVIQDFTNIFAFSVKECLYQIVKQIIVVLVLILNKN